MSDTSPLKPGLGASTRIMFRLLPGWVRRSATVAVVLSAGLGLLELLALVLLFPVFTYMTAPAGTADPVPWLPGDWDQQTVQWAAVLALGLMMARSLLSLAVRSWWLGRTAQAELELSNEVLHRYTFAPFSFHLSSHSSELMARVVAHVNLTCTAGLSGVVSALTEALIALGLACGLIVVDPTVGLVVVAYVALLAMGYAVATRRAVNSASARYAEATAVVYKDVNVMLQGMRELTVLGARDDHLSHVAADRATMVRSQRTLGVAREVPKAVLEVALYASVLVVLAVLFARGGLQEALPLVALYVLAGTRIVPAIARMLSGVAQARMGLNVAGDLAVELDTLAAMDDVPSTGTEGSYPRQATLTLTDVGYHYPGSNAEVLSGVTLDVPFGSFVGVVGPSGAGKTTLTGLILGLLPPTSGSIRYGTEPLRSGDAAWYRRVAVLSQEVFLTDRSLRDNLLAGDATHEQIHDALTRSGLAGLVDQLPEGIDTPLGEGGSRLSAGQRQRVGIARALLRNADVLVLDEPTSALDRDSEALIMSTLNDLSGVCTVICVAHRVETLRSADLVVALADGQMVAAGPPEQVLGPVTIDLRQILGQDAGPLA